MSGKFSEKAEELYFAITQSTPIRHVLSFESIPSTSDYAKELLRTQNPDSLQLPLLICADHQTAGRGQGEKKWWTGKGAIAVSLVLVFEETSLSRDNLPTFSLHVGQVVAETLGYFLAKTANGRCDRKKNMITVKPPNDVYLDGKKIAGILIESPTPQVVIIGIGVNLNNSLCGLPQELQETPITTLIDVTGEAVDRTEFLRVLFQQLFKVISGKEPNTTVSKNGYHS